VTLHINEIQVIDPDKLFKVSASAEELKDFGVDNSKFTRESNLKKLQLERNRNLNSKVETSKYNLRKRKI
jgi:hypothetical protein